MLKKYLQKNAIIIARNTIKTEVNKMYSSQCKTIENELKELLNKKLDWQKGESPEYPLFFKSAKYDLKIKINDSYPEKPLYSLIVNNETVADLESLPSAWKQEKSSLKL